MWKLRKTFTEEIDGYDGIEYCKHDSGQIQKTIFVLNEEEVLELYENLTIKYKDYSEESDPIPRTVKRLVRLKEKLRDLEEIISLIKGENNE